MTKQTAVSEGHRPRLHIVLAALLRADRVFIAKRPVAAHQGGCWEFPGGKLEDAETPAQALQRELGEEVGVQVTQARPLIRFPYDYPDRSVFLDVWLVTDFVGEPRGAEGQEVRWIGKAELGNYPFPPANGPILKALTLPRHYLITPDPPGSQAWPDFLSGLQRSLERGIRLVQFRAPALDEEEYSKLAAMVIAQCRKFGARILLNHEPALVQTLGADGVHLNSTRLGHHATRPLPAGMLVAASCHSQAELVKAENLGCDFAVLSPVQFTATHPQAEPLGWQRFQRMTDAARVPVYALGGMSAEDGERAYWYGAQGIAAIRSLWAV